MPDPLIQIRGVTKVYRRDQFDVPVLQGIELTIKPGAIFVGSSNMELPKTAEPEAPKPPHPAAEAEEAAPKRKPRLEIE